MATGMLYQNPGQEEKLMSILLITPKLLPLILLYMKDSIFWKNRPVTINQAMIILW